MVDSKKILLRVPWPLVERFNAIRGDVPMNTALIRSMEETVRSGVLPKPEGVISGESPNVADGPRQSDEGSIPSASIPDVGNDLARKPVKPHPRGGKK